MMKDDEKRFLVDVYKLSLDKEWSYPFGFPIYAQKMFPRDLINEPGFYMHHKRAWYLLDKWSSKGWYDYGVTLDSGWITNDGAEKARKVLVEVGK